MKKINESKSICDKNNSNFQEKKNTKTHKTNVLTRK